MLMGLKEEDFLNELNHALSKPSEKQGHLLNYAEQNFE